MKPFSCTIIRIPLFFMISVFCLAPASAENDPINLPDHTYAQANTQNEASSAGSFQTTGYTPKGLDVTDCLDVNDGLLWSKVFDGQEFRFGGVDTNAVYWRIHLPNLSQTRFKDAHFEIRGEYPHARYFSYHLNAENTNFIDKLTDYEIAPDPGSRNPYNSDLPFAAGNTYTIKVVDVEDKRGILGRNILRGGFFERKPVKKNVILYRIYEPFTGRDGGVKLPRIYFVSDDPDFEGFSDKNQICELFKSSGGVRDFIFKLEKRVLDRTARRLAKNPNKRTPGYKPPNPVEWIIGINFFGMMNHAFPRIPDNLITETPTGANMDTRYLAGFLDPTNELTLVKFKTPEIEKQVRYWSVCVMQPFNGLLYTWSCARHNELKTDANGYSTIVFSSPKDRPEDTCVPGNQSAQTTSCKNNWMPYGSRVPLVWIRQLVSRKNYGESLVNFKGDYYDAAEIKAHMGEYYPKTRYCELSQYYSGNCNLP